MGKEILSLKAHKDNSYKTAQLTFQIGLHKDDLDVLKFIKSTLHWGSITGSKDKIFIF
jgi:hypothetical protein